MNATIPYTWIDDECTLRCGTYTGDPERAILRGADALDAESVEDAQYRYHADETGEDYLVDVEDVASLGAALLGGHSMSECYSIWCADTDAREVTS